MQLFIEETYEDMSRRAADLIAAQLIVDPASTLGLATGSTPIGLYADLVEDFQADRISFEQVTTFNLDEYRGLSPEHDQSYRYFMQKNLFDHVDIDPEATSVPDGANPDAQAACESYEQAISEAGGIDLQLLGLGHNGHIGFNEPCDKFPVRTHVVELTESTINANSRLFESIDQVPREAYTMGIGTIMKAPIRRRSCATRSSVPSPRRFPRLCCSCILTSPSWWTPRPARCCKACCCYSR